jgi:signal transduction histidine kinase
MFFRASLKSQGSGLGLYIVRNSVEKMGGSVRLKSQVGVGTEFIVDLPNEPVEDVKR